MRKNNGVREGRSSSVRTRNVLESYSRGWLWTASWVWFEQHNDLHYSPLARRLAFEIYQVVVDLEACN